VLAEVPVSPDWIGEHVSRLEEATRSRVALLTRLGDGMLPNASTLLQEGDLVHVVTEWDRIDVVTAICAEPPQESDG
jgi:trk system potassium uptake protein TrkA